jgi:hypothetical protein
MELAILLSLAASACTATSSVRQRLGARPFELCGEMRGFDALLVFRLAGPPTWLLGLACMIVFQERLITRTTQPRRPEAGEATNRELTRRSR